MTWSVDEPICRVKRESRNLPYNIVDYFEHHDLPDPSELPVSLLFNFTDHVLLPTKQLDHAHDTDSFGRSLHSSVCLIGCICSERRQYSRAVCGPTSFILWVCASLIFLPIHPGIGTNTTMLAAPTNALFHCHKISFREDYTPGRELIPPSENLIQEDNTKGHHHRNLNDWKLRSCQVKDISLRWYKT